MLKLSAPRGSWTIELAPGAILHLRGAQPADTVIARDAAAGMASGTPKEDFWAIFWASFAHTLLLRLLEGWEGIGDRDGNPLPVTPDSISALLTVPAIYGRIEAELIRPLWLRIEEKNASSPSPNGTSEGASKAVLQTAAGAVTAGSA